MARYPWSLFVFSVSAFVSDRMRLCQSFDPVLVSQTSRRGITSAFGVISGSAAFHKRRD